MPTLGEVIANVQRNLLELIGKIKRGESVTQTLERIRKERPAVGEPGVASAGGRVLRSLIPAEKLVDFYSVKPPYSYVLIYIDDQERIRYHTIEPILTRRELAGLIKLKALLFQEFHVRGDILRKSVKDPLEAGKLIAQTVRRMARDYGLKLPVLSIEKLTYYVVRDTVGYGPLDVIINDPAIEDIFCDGTGLPIYVWHQRYEWLRSNVVFIDEDELMRYVRKLAVRSGKELSYAQPLLDGAIPPWKYRLHATHPVVTYRGPSFTIRKFRENPFTLPELVRLGTLPPEIAAYLWILVDSINSALVVGAMASGKTTLLNAIAMMIPPESKIVTAEDTPEIRLPHENWVAMVTRPSSEPGVEDITLYDLLRSALRQRPEFIIVGEIRGEEAFTFFQAVSVGHGGLGTVHGETIDAAIKRLITKPMDVPKGLIPAVKVFILNARVKYGGKIVRRSLEVREIITIDERGELVMNTAFKWDPETDSWEEAQHLYLIENAAEKMLVDYNQLYNEMKRRALIMKWMAWREKTSVRDVMDMVRRYRRNPDMVFTQVASELRASGLMEEVALL
ncbi:typeII/typeIV secretory system protein ATPase [Ignicoccus islandicus DSM 13165]|uniref:TypeII/typeIV secretory system protein ATPase n=1 Tax=Ignicoccus islandicus DSM 13165 TaxID=940295 RepID=A0A0U2WKQ5_9CREN|nr:type II/IV secretion system ATPase subunit [Ignicoccus islandicus]ALU11521.1 typeII/typeIV secretory system protein ATPase [Ignicoccus islandicus DSM 13165]